MSVLGKVLGNASSIDESTQNVERLFLEDEKALKIYKFVRDEIVITNKGFYHINVEGIGVKVETKFFPISSLQFISIETKGLIDIGFDIHIGVTGNVKEHEGRMVFEPIKIQVSKKNYVEGLDLFKVVKTLIV